MKAELKSTELLPGYVVAVEIATNDVKAFAEYHLEKTIDIEKIKEDYPDVIEAVGLGLISFDEDQTPTLTLRKPVKDINGTIVVEYLNFRTRMLASDQERLAKGVDMKVDSFKLINRFKGFFITQPVAMLDKFGKFDLRVIDQLTSVFM
jgi:hypothetical protein